MPLLYVLPVLLLLAAVVLGLVARYRSDQPLSPVAPHGPLTLVPVEAPNATSSACRQLLAELPNALATDTGELHRVGLAAPAPDGAAAWVGDAGVRPVVLRCGLPRPAELRPTSELIDIDQVGWLALSSSDVDSFIAVDRAVYIALTVPRGLGTGPVQTVSDAIRSALPRTDR
jgi:Protein of unknown function (DUF3515)